MRWALVGWCKRVVDNPWLTRIILLLIVLNAAILGLETVPRLEAAHGQTFHLINNIVLGAFVIEFLLKFFALWPTAYRYFESGWNIFDFTIIVLSFIPAVGTGVTVIRLLRLLRLVSIVPELRLIVSTIFRSIASIGAVMFLLMLIFYIYAVSGVHLFSATDPARWESLPTATMTLFGVLTLDEWTEVFRATHSPYAWIFFTSFVFIAAFIILNLFIAIIIYNLQRVEREVAKKHEMTLIGELRLLKERLLHLEHKRP